MKKKPAPCNKITAKKKKKRKGRMALHAHQTRPREKMTILNDIEKAMPQHSIQFPNFERNNQKHPIY
jgi:hypothetical protein